MIEVGRPGRQVVPASPSSILGVTCEWCRDLNSERECPSTPQDGVEEESKRPVGLAAMLRGETEEDDAALPDHYRHHRRLALDLLGAEQPAAFERVGRCVTHH